MGWEGKERGEVVAGLAVVGGKRCTVSPGHCEVVVAAELLCCVCVSCSPLVLFGCCVLFDGQKIVVSSCCVIL